MPSKELSGSAKVTAFSFMRRRERGIAGKGMENQYEENLLRPYSKISLDGGTRTEIGCSFDSPQKTHFAWHVFSDGTIEYFERFDDLHTVVQEILRGSGNSYKLVHLIGKGETPTRRRRGFAERLAGAGQIGQGFTDRNQAAALTLHGFILPCPSDKTGTLPASIPDPSSLEPAPPEAS